MADDTREARPRFLIITKRIDQFAQCVPDDWGWGLALSILSLTFAFLYLLSPVWGKGVFMVLQAP